MLSVLSVLLLLCAAEAFNPRICPPGPYNPPYYEADFCCPFYENADQPFARCCPTPTASDVGWESDEIFVTIENNNEDELKYWTFCNYYHFYPKCRRRGVYAKIKVFHRWGSSPVFSVDSETGERTYYPLPSTVKRQETWATVTYYWASINQFIIFNYHYFVNDLGEPDATVTTWNTGTAFLHVPGCHYEKKNGHFPLYDDQFAIWSAPAGTIPNVDAFIRANVGTFWAPMIRMPGLTGTGWIYDCATPTLDDVADSPFVPCSTSNQQENEMLVGAADTSNIYPFSGGMFFNNHDHDIGGLQYFYTTSDTDFLFSGSTPYATRMIPQGTPIYRSTIGYTLTTLYNITTDGEVITAKPDMSISMDFLSIRQRSWEVAGVSGDALNCGIDPWTTIYKYDTTDPWFGEGYCFWEHNEASPMNYLFEILVSAQRATELNKTKTSAANDHNDDDGVVVDDEEDGDEANTDEGDRQAQCGKPQTKAQSKPPQHRKPPQQGKAQGRPQHDKAQGKPQQHGKPQQQGKPQQHGKAQGKSQQGKPQDRNQRSQRGSRNEL